MRIVTRVLIVAALVFGSGCAQTDWIDRTLVTVDVTGTWQGTGQLGTQYTFNLKQEGPKVTGSIQAAGPSAPQLSGPVTGTVAGDVFTFRLTNSRLSGEMTVSGDEMTGTLNVTGWRPQIFTLRSVDPSSRQDSPRR